MLHVIASVLAIALLLWSTNFLGFIVHVEAANVTDASDTISDSDLSALANHTIQFTTPNGLVSGQTIELTFDGNFTLPVAGFDFNDLDLATATEEVLGTSAGAGVWGVATTSSTITLTTPTDRTNTLSR